MTFFSVKMTLLYLNYLFKIGNKKITTEYSINDDGKKTKIVRTFEIVKKRVPKAEAHRKALPKFGMSRNDK